MRAECQFAKAGQGLFYNGILVSGNKNRKDRVFSFVYDCGTSDAAKVLDGSVMAYKSLIKEHIDMLFISHLHEDHISHIPKLIADMNIGIVVLPDIVPEIRLLLASVFDNIEANGEIISLYSDPVDYFVKRRVSQVVIMMSNNGENFFLKENPEKGHSQHSDDYSDGEKTNDGIIIQALNGRIKEKSCQDNTIITKYEDAVQIRIQRFAWEFRAVNVHHECYDDNLIKKIKEIMDDNDNNFFYILKNKELLKKLRCIYKKSYEGNINDTSVIVRSYPVHGGYVIDGDGLNRIFVYKNDDNCQEECMKQGHAETLLLGDISMNSKVLTHVDCYLKNYNHLPRVIQLPHHGARIRCCPKYCKSLKKIRVYGFCSTLVASYGLKNMYGHPDFCFYGHCCSFCFGNYSLIRLVNERQDYSYTVLSH